MNHTPYRSVPPVDDSDSELSHRHCDSGSDNDYSSPLRVRRPRHSEQTTISSMSSSQHLSLTTSPPTHDNNLVSPSTSPLLNAAPRKRLASQQFLATLPPTLVEEVIEDYVSVYGYEPTQTILVSILQEKLMVLARDYRNQERNRNRLYLDMTCTGDRKKRGRSEDSPNVDFKMTCKAGEDGVLGENDTDMGCPGEEYDDFSQEIEFLLGNVTVTEQDAPSYIS